MISGIHRERELHMLHNDIDTGTTKPALCACVISRCDYAASLFWNTDHMDMPTAFLASFRFMRHA